MHRVHQFSHSTAPGSEIPFRLSILSIFCRIPFFFLSFIFVRQFETIFPPPIAFPRIEFQCFFFLLVCFALVRVRDYSPRRSHPSASNDLLQPSQFFRHDLQLSHMHTVQADRGSKLSHVPVWLTPLREPGINHETTKLLPHPFWVGERRITRLKAQESTCKGSKRKMSSLIMKSPCMINVMELAR